MGVPGRNKVGREHAPESVAWQFLELHESVSAGSERTDQRPETIDQSLSGK